MAEAASEIARLLAVRPDASDSIGGHLRATNCPRIARGHMLDGRRKAGLRETWPETESTI